jgi:hypothetical protein
LRREFGCKLLNIKNVQLPKLGLVDATASHEMRTLMRADAGGLGSDANDALRRVGRAPSSVIAKFGLGDDGFRHECAIIERAVDGKDLRYVAVGLGYSPKRRLQNWFDLFVLLDEVIVTRKTRSSSRGISEATPIQFWEGADNQTRVG